LLRVASSNNLTRFYALLKEGADVNAHDQKGLTPLMAVSFAGNAEMAKVLLERGARVNDQSIDGKTALHYAAEHSHAADVISVLLKAGADLNVKSNATSGYLPGATPLIIAASVGNASAVELLLKAGADSNALTLSRMTALDVARHPPMIPRPGHAEVIEKLERLAH
jgi:ankyrin repeat protein